MGNKNYPEYFIDITFKIVPKCYRPYKILTIATLDIKENKTIIVGFVMFKYMDQESYIRIFKLLHDNYNFNPHILHTDFEIALCKAIKSSNFFEKKVLNIKCFFHFIKACREKLKKLGATKKGLNKETYEILNNVELLCLIDIDKMERYKKFLLENIDKLNKYKEFVSYLKNFWFKRPNEEYNYSKFIHKYIDNKNALEKLYLTNNITESIHAKLNYFLPRHITNQFNFINSLKNILINNAFKNSDIVRKDYKTKSLLLLIDKENLNENFKWIDYNTFKIYLKKIVNNNNENLDNDESENLIKLIENEIEDVNRNN